MVPELFKRYLIVVNPTRGTTSIYCQECGTWVARYEGDQITTHSEEELLEKIVNDHKQDFPDLVGFGNGTETFK